MCPNVVNAPKGEEFRVVANIVRCLVVFRRQHHQDRIAAELVLGRPHHGRNVDALGGRIENNLVAVGSVVGIGGMAGALGAMGILKLTGYILAHTGSYVVLFLIAASAYVIALAVLHTLAPRLAPAKL